MAEPARKPSPHWNMRAPSRVNKITLPPNDGPLTEPLSAQKRYLKALMAAALTGGNLAADALRRATEALEQCRLEAVSNKLDSEAQEALKMFTTAGMRAGGISSGVHVAMQAMVSVRLYEEWLAGQRKREKAKARKGEAQ